MESAIPKQYLPLQGKPVLQLSLEKLMSVPELASIMVALNPDDRHFAPVLAGCAGSASSRRNLAHSPDGNETQETAATAENRHGMVSSGLETTRGGNTRAQSVLNALDALKSRAAGDDWVLVHDAVRPCVLLSDIVKLLAECRDHAVGGLLAVPQDNTLKQADRSLHVTKTVDRSVLWQALTPQLFRFGLLHQAMVKALEQGGTITDESSAVELLGLRPLLVHGERHNIKITRKSDLALADAILRLQQSDRDRA